MAAEVVLASFHRIYSGLLEVLYCRSFVAAAEVVVGVERQVWACDRTFSVDLCGPVRDLVR